MQLWTRLSDTGLELIGKDIGIRVDISNSEKISRGRHKNMNKIQFTLKPESDTYRKISFHGLAYGQGERRVNAVCWHGHFEFMKQLFLRDYQAHLKTAMANYDGPQGFLDNFLETGYTNMGSQMYPVQYRESCNCSLEGLDMIDTSELEIISQELTTIKQSDMLACPHTIMVPSHYMEDGRCRCTDFGHLEMRDWGYTWNGESWVA